MAKVKVLSRLEQAVSFDFRTYSKSGKKTGGIEVNPIDLTKRIVISGINEVFNHGRIVMPYAVTEFSDDIAERDVEKRKYPLSDFERLKKDPLFADYVKRGEMSIDTADDISHDITGQGKLTQRELDERSAREEEKIRNTTAPTIQLTRL